MEADMSLWSLVSRASVLVQLVMISLLAASVLSWIIIIIKHKVLKLAREEALRFEDQFWSGINLADLYARTKRNTGEAGGMARIFEAGFAEYVRIHKKIGANTEMMLAGVQRSMKVALAREEERLDSNLSLLATIGSIWIWWKSIWGH